MNNPAEATSRNNLAVARFMLLDFQAAKDKWSRRRQAVSGSTLPLKIPRAISHVRRRFRHGGPRGRPGDRLNPQGGSERTFRWQRMAVYRGNVAEARRWYDVMGKGDPRARRLAAVAAADLAVYVGDFQQARGLLTSSIPSDIAAGSMVSAATKRLLLAELALLEGDHKAAAAEAIAVRSLVRSPQVSFRAAMILLETGQVSEAIATINQLPQELQGPDLCTGLSPTPKWHYAGRIWPRSRDSTRAWPRGEVRGWRAFEPACSCSKHNSPQPPWRISDWCVENRHEAAAAYLDDVPTIRYWADAWYWSGVASEAAGNTRAAIANYRSFLTVRGGRSRSAERRIDRAWRSCRQQHRERRKEAYDSLVVQFVVSDPASSGDRAPDPRGIRFHFHHGAARHARDRHHRAGAARADRAVQGGDTASAAAIYGLFGTVWAAMQFIFSPVLGSLSDRFGRRKVILLSNFGLGLDYLLMAMAPSLGWLFVGRVISGITSSSFPTAAAYIADVTPPEERAAKFGMLGAAFGVGFIVGPAIGGLLGGFSLHAPFWGAAALSLANFVYGFFILPSHCRRTPRAVSLAPRESGRRDSDAPGASPSSRSDAPASSRCSRTTRFRPRSCSIRTTVITGVSGWSASRWPWSASLRLIVQGGLVGRIVAAVRGAPFAGDRILLWRRRNVRIWVRANRNDFPARHPPYRALRVVDAVAAEPDDAPGRSV